MNIDIIVESIKYRNFKGIKNYTFKPNATVTNVFGKNGACKSTLYDGFRWCLFGKDSKDRADFGIKPTDKDNNEIPYLENEVETVLLVNGKRITLTRTQLEKWTTPRGKKEKVFTGNYNEFKFDGVPMDTKGKFSARVESEICSENVFKLITNLNEFNNLHWTKKRDALFEMAGSLSDEVIAATNENLKGFIDMLNGKTVDDFRKTIGAAITKIKESKKKIPVRLNENQHSTPDSPEFTKLDLENKLIELQGVITEIDKSITDISSRNQANDQVGKDISTLKSKIHQIEITENNKLQSERNQLENQLSTIKNNIDFEQKKIIRINKDQESYTNEVLDIEKITSGLRTQIAEIKLKTFLEPDRETFTCKSCNQQLPTENIEETINTMKVTFSDNVKTEIKAIQVKGLANNKKVTDIQSEMKLTEVKIDGCNESITKYETEKKNLELLLSKPLVRITDFAGNIEHANVLKRIAELEAKIAVNDDTANLIELKNTTDKDIKQVEELLRTYKTISDKTVRHNEILAEEQILIDELVSLESQEFKCEEFIRTKVELTDDKINSMFSFCKIKMFEKQVNGNIVETCKVLVNTNGCLVEYSDANTAGQINAGLDIVNTLSKHYGVIAPIFIDHKESVTDIVKTDSQIIGLHVSAKHEFLTIE